MPRLFLASALLTLLTGCSAAYHAPGGAADFRALGITPEAQKAGTAVDIQAAFDKKPLAAFPANVAVVRIQQPGYRSETVHASHGSGAFSVVTARDVESEDAIDRLRKLPHVRGIAPLGRMLMPNHFGSDRDLRAAAAQLQCDLLLVYTFDTAFHDRDLATPISVITLGLAPTQATQVTTTASAVLFDTRNGYVYGLAEATASRKGLATAWNTKDAIDADRLKTEAEAFDKLVGNLETMWKGVVKEVGPDAPRGTKYGTGQ